jgi:hypothetical protein
MAMGAASVGAGVPTGVRKPKTGSIVKGCTVLFVPLAAKANLSRGFTTGVIGAGVVPLGCVIGTVVVVVFTGAVVVAVLVGATGALLEPGAVLFELEELLLPEQPRGNARAPSTVRPARLRRRMIEDSSPRGGQGALQA